MFGVGCGLVERAEDAVAEELGIFSCGKPLNIYEL